MAVSNAPKTQEAFKGSYRAEFSMGQYHYDRIAKICMFIDEESIRVNNYDQTAEQAHSLFPYYSGLRTLFKSLIPLMHINARRKFEKMFKIVHNDIVEFSNEIGNNEEEQEMDLPIMTIKRLNIIHEELYQKMQLMGLGIIATENISDIDRIKRATA